MHMHFHIEVVTDEIPDESDIDDLFDRTYFDYWEIGGRWAGSHTDDPRNDTIPIEELLDSLSAYAILKDSKAIYFNEEQSINPCGALRIYYKDGALDLKATLEKYNITTGYVTTVDCHW
jgi:hypothetical protein